MNKILSFLLCFILLMQCMCFCVSATASDDITTTFTAEASGEKVRVYVFAEPNAQVGIEVINPNGTFPPASNDKTTILNSFSHLGEITTNAAGTGKFDFSVKSAGTYTVRYSKNVTRAMIYPQPEKEFFALTFPSIDTVFDNVINVPHITIRENMKANAVGVVNALSSQPDGKKSMFFGWEDFSEMLTENTRNYIWWDEGVEKLNVLLDGFFDEYKKAGGMLDYIYLDLELYLTAAQLGTDYSKCQAIVDDSAYESEIKPLLAERGFEFCEDGEHGELYYLIDSSNKERYTRLRYIWNTVMLNRTAEYLSYAVYEPAKKYFPNVKMSDWDKADMDSWYKIVNYGGEEIYQGGSTVKTGTHSNYSVYGDRISGIVKNPPEDYLGVSFEATPFHAMMYDVNRIRAAYLSNSEAKIQPWVAYYDYKGLEGFHTNVGNTPYYAEMLFHTGMLEPDPYLAYIPYGTKPYETVLNQELVLSLILEELSTVLPLESRTPIKPVVNWNTHYMLSGMRVGDKNIWRITPDISIEGVTLENFVVNKEIPTFSIKGHTIRFDEGKILDIDFGSNTCGYWIETPSNVLPEEILDANIPKINPIICLDFEEYDKANLPMNFTQDMFQRYYETKAIYPQSGSFMIESENEANQVLSMSGDNSALRYLEYPQMVKVLGENKKRQTWEIKIKLPTVSDWNASCYLFGYGAEEWSATSGNAVIIRKNQIYCKNGGTEVKILDSKNLLSTNQWYTIKRVLDFSSENTISSVYVYDESGNLIGSAEGLVGKNDDFPIKEIIFGASKYSSNEKIFLDDFLIYPDGLDLRLEIYDGKTGMLKNNVPKENMVTARLSYNNAQKTDSEFVLIRAIYEKDSLKATQTLSSGVMKAGADGVIICEMMPVEGEKITEKFFIWDTLTKVRPLYPNVNIVRE